MKTLRIAMLGAGGIAACHARHWLQLPQVQIVAVIDPERRRAQAFAKEFACDAPLFADFAEVPDALADVLDICTPPLHHSALIQDAVGRGLDVVCEKPLACSIHELDEMLAFIAESDRLVLPVFQNRYGIGARQLDALLAAGLAGRFRHATVSLHWRRETDYWQTWHGDPAISAGGVWAQLAIHPLDLALRLAPPLRQVQSLVGQAVYAQKVEECGSALLACDDEAWIAAVASSLAHSQRTTMSLVYEHLQVEVGPDPYGFACQPWAISSADPERQAEINDICTRVQAYSIPSGCEEHWFAFHQTAAAILRRERSAQGCDAVSARPVHAAIAAIVSGGASMPQHASAANPLPLVARDR